MRSSAVLAVAVVAVALLALALALHPQPREPFAADTGLDWMRKAFAALRPDECVEVELGAAGARVQRSARPEDMAAYRELLLGAADRGAFVVHPAAPNRATVALRPTSPFFRALADMDALARRHAPALAALGTPARPFAELSAPVVSAVAVADGVVLWTVRPELDSAPRGRSIALRDLLTFARLLQALDDASTDGKRIEGARMREVAATETHVDRVKHRARVATDALNAEVVRGNAALRTTQQANERNNAALFARATELAAQAEDAQRQTLALDAEAAALRDKAVQTRASVVVQSQLERDLQVKK